MLDLFDDVPKPDIDWHPHWLPANEAADLLQRVSAEVSWQQDMMKTPAGEVPLPRLTAWQGEPRAVYVYSGIRNVPAPWTGAVSALRDAVQAISGTGFNSVLLNRYRSGDDGMGWHADKEPELGAAPLIASVSLGVPRTFQLRHNKTGTLHDLPLGAGSLLVMRGRTQADWKHRVPKEPKVRGERINLTFRWVAPR